MMLGKTTSFAALVGVTVALFMSTMTPAGAVCSNGLEGVQSTSLDVCCVEGCGVCGGVGCTPANTSSLTSGDCCATEIVESGVFCDVSGAAPCIVTTAAASNDSVCLNGQTGVQDPDTDVCCPLECGDFCGGEGCGSIPGVDASQCCATAIMASGDICSDTVLPPCTVQATATDNSTTCSNGVVGFEDPVNLICCDAACGLCGGAGCGDVPGLSGAECCSAEIELAGLLCSVTGTAPCIVDPPDFTPSMCPNGLAGVQDGSVCCAEECDGQCGGVGCGSIVGTNGASDCCSATILASGVTCDLGVEAPCVMLNGTYTDAPAATPTVPSNVTAGATPAPSAGSRDLFTEAPTMMGDVNGDGLVNSADTGIVGDTNGDGVVDANDTGIVGDTNGDGVVNDLDLSDTNGDGVIDERDAVTATTAPTAAPTAAPTIAPTVAERDISITPAPTTGPPTIAPTAAPSITPSPADTNGDGIVDSNDGVDTNGDGLIDSQDGIDFNEDGVIDSRDAPVDLGETPAPADASETAGNGAMSTVAVAPRSVYAACVLVGAFVVGGIVL